jgi:D-amino-acid dehydrogenase
MTTKTDVLIIGGGSIGLNTAYYLLKSGRAVTLLDRSAIGVGSSSGNAGHIVPSHIVPLAAPGIIPTALKWMLDPENSPFGMKLSLSPAYLSWLIRFAASCTEDNVTCAIPALKALGLLSARNFSEIISAEKFDCSYQQSGLLFLYNTSAAFESGKHEAEILHKHGLPAGVLEKDRVHQVEPAALQSVIGGVHFTGDSSLNPAKFLHLLAGCVRAMGADLHEHTPVTGFDASGGRIDRVLTPQGEYEPSLVVLAAGAWSPIVARNLHLNIPVQPARGYSLTMSAARTMPRQALLLGERRVAVTPMGDKLRFTGRLEVGNMSTTPEPKWITAIERSVREYIQLDEKLDIQETWAGLRPTTPDGVPLIGFSSRFSNLMLATGHAMLGLSLGPGTGQVVAELANGVQPVFELSTFSPHRFS